MKINGVAPGILAEEAKRSGALLVHYSTDYVFDGAKTAPYVEDDAPNPLGAYGRSKLAGDEAVRAVGGAHLIFRLCWVYGARGQNFMLTIMRLARERESLRVVSDQIGCPTWSRMIAETTALALRQAGARFRRLHRHLSSGVLGRHQLAWLRGSIVNHMPAKGGNARASKRSPRRNIPRSRNARPIRSSPAKSSNASLASNCRLGT